MSVPFISPTWRIVLGLVALTTSIVLVATSLGFFPSHRTAIGEGRKQLCEALAIDFSELAGDLNSIELESHFQRVIDRCDDVLSIGVRQVDGTESIQIGDHFSTWTLSHDASSTEEEMVIPIYSNDLHWGTLEVRFEPVKSTGPGGWAASPELLLAGFVAIVGLVVFYIYLRIVLRQLNPSNAIPSRVRDALDSLAEGLVILDSNERIVLANESFQNATQKKFEELVGRQVGTLPFDSLHASGQAGIRLPWRETLATGRRVKGMLLGLSRDSEQLTFSVSCSTIVDEKGRNRGAIVSFEDVTRLESQKNELKKMVRELGNSSEEIQRQNRELEILATRDALTGCLNRRVFWDTFDREFTDATRQERPLSALMVDIDHFKSINDNYGHAFGDEVLRKVAGVLEDVVDDSGIVCRYGGEEFSILLAGMEIDDAAVLAEQIRVEIELLRFQNVTVSASLGVSAFDSESQSPQELLEKADKCLYSAKRRGRNVVVRWDEITDFDETEVTQDDRDDAMDESTPTPITMEAIDGILTLMELQYPAVVQHCRRVAEYCVICGKDWLSQESLSLVKAAALLHETDRMFRSPDPLQSERSTKPDGKTPPPSCGLVGNLAQRLFDSEELSNILANWQLPYPAISGQHDSESIGLLAISHRYDELTFGDGKSTTEAIETLHGESETDYDPVWITRFVDALHALQKGVFSENQLDDVSSSSESLGCV